VSQDINFYSRDFRPRLDWLGLNLSLVYGVVLLLILSAVSLFEVYSQRQVISNLSQEEIENRDWKDKIAKLERIITERAKDPALERRVLELESTQKDKLMLQKFLMQELSGNVLGFSSYFMDFARYHLDGLRLTTIDLFEGGESLRLTGEVVSGELVTLYIEALGQSDNFKGKSFTGLNMSLNTGGSGAKMDAAGGQNLLNFTVETEQGDRREL